MKYYKWLKYLLAPIGCWLGYAFTAAILNSIDNGWEGFFDAFISKSLSNGPIVPTLLGSAIIIPIAIYLNKKPKKD